MTKNRQVCEFHHRPKRGVRRLLCAGSVVAAAALAPTLAAAQEDGEGEGDTIVVSGYRYLSENTSGTTGLPVTIEKVPQSLSLVSEDFLDATDARSLGDVAKYTLGAVFEDRKSNRLTTRKYCV